MPLLTSKVTPSSNETVTSKVTPSSNETVTSKVTPSSNESMFLMLLHTLFSMYGVQRHPKLSSFETLKTNKALTEYKYVPPDSTIIYISHEWVGTHHPDPKGDQIYHLLLLLERLCRGEVDRTDMDAFHSILYVGSSKIQSRTQKYITRTQVQAKLHNDCGRLETHIGSREDVHFLRRILCTERETRGSVSNGTWCSSAKRENLNDPTFFMLSQKCQLYHSYPFIS